MAVNYLDRFLSLVPVKRSKLQLVGTACMFISACVKGNIVPFREPLIRFCLDGHIQQIRRNLPPADPGVCLYLRQHVQAI